ncbi:MAG: hypothetical protein ABIB71_08785, partial [Candidatus Woesearchaeota archaeon]
QKKDICIDTLGCPVYFISNLDSSFYTTHLNSTLNNKLTRELKESLIHIDNKIRVINRVVELAQEARFLDSNPQRQKGLIHELKKEDFKIYKELNQFLTKAKEEVYKIEGYNKP